MAEDLDTWKRKRAETLEVQNPHVRCGHCNFESSLKGTWSVEDGRLVFRADADPLRGRGPDFHGCGESSETTVFKRITVGYDDEPLTGEQFAALQATAREAPWDDA